MGDVKWIKQIKAIGFDVDGTLYSSPPEMSAAVGRMLIAKAAQDLAREADEFAMEYLKRRDELRSNTLTLNSFGLDGQRIFQDIWDQISVEKYVKRDNRLTKTIAQLMEKYRIFLISNGTGSQIERKITYLGLDYHDFDPRIYCYDREWVKPEPAPFFAAIELLNLKPEEIVYVGDRVDTDIEGARAVGMKTILVGSDSELADASCSTVYDVGLLL